MKVKITRESLESLKRALNWDPRLTTFSRHTNPSPQGLLNDLTPVLHRPIELSLAALRRVIP